MPKVLTRRIFKHLVDGTLPPYHAGRKRLARPTYGLFREPILQRLSQVCPPRRYHGAVDSLLKNKQTDNVVSYGTSLNQMIDLVKRQRVHARLPHHDVIAGALRDFAKQCAERRCAIEDMQAYLVYKSLEYCSSAAAEVAGKPTIAFDEITLSEILGAIEISKEISEFHVHICRVAYASFGTVSRTTALLALKVYCQVMVRRGLWEEALDVLQQHEANTDTQLWTLLQRERAVAESTQGAEVYLETWTYVLRGAAESGAEANLRRVYDLICLREMQQRPAIILIMLEFYQRKNDYTEMKNWWIALIRSKSKHTSPTLSNGHERHALYTSDHIEEYGPLEKTLPQALKHLLGWCLEKGRIEMGNELVADVLDTNPDLTLWNIIFVWAAACGKSADEIDRMMDVMERMNADVADPRLWRVADTSTINELVAIAMSRKNSYLAERFLGIGSRRGIPQDDRTFSLQMQYRLQVDDIDGALAAYEKLKTATPSLSEDATAVNKLIRSLCVTRSSNFETIMSVARDMSEHVVAFEAETVSELITLHLRRDEAHDVEDLLTTSVCNFSSSQRSCVSASLVRFCTDLSVDTAMAWRAYNILRESFDEISRPIRTTIMSSFFERGRADMAVHVFNHMRSHSRLNTVASSETYIAAFSSIGRLKDLESLEIIHNRLKLDYNVESNTSLRNALMFAYMSCGKERSALNIWDEIVASKEGPSYESIRVALRACEGSPFGAQEAQEIWQVLLSRQVELSDELWAAYVSAIAKTGDIASVIAIIESSEGHAALKVDVHLLGLLCMATPDAPAQNEIESWMALRYPDHWNELQGLKIAAHSETTARNVYEIERRSVLVNAL